jgi:hypothetical protein
MPEYFLKEKKYHRTSKDEFDTAFVDVSHKLLFEAGSFEKLKTA